MLFFAFEFQPFTRHDTRTDSQMRRAAAQGVRTLAVPTLLAGIMLSGASALWATPIRLAQNADVKTGPTFGIVTSKAYLLGPEDTLNITLANHPALNGTVTVRPDGKITFPRAGDVQAAGHTTTGLAAILKRLLERSLNNVRVEVQVSRARPRLARIIGAVKTPGTYDIKTSWRVLDLVAASGGLTTRAARISARIIRGPQIINLDFPRAIAEPDSIANVSIWPNDLLSLDESAVPYQVTVSGKVLRPGAYDLEDGLSLTKLLAKAGGPTEGAALRKAQVLRGGVPIDIDVSESELQNPESPASRFTLQIGDILMVPENQLRYGIMGQVVRPAYYTLPENIQDNTLLKLLGNAGGAMVDADLRNATITHTASGKVDVTTVDLNAVLQGQVPDTQSLKAGDLLFIPRRTAQVTVAGEVNKPDTYVMDERMTVPSLIAQAGNLKPSAALSKAFVMRSGNRVPLDLSSFYTGGTPDAQADSFRLQAGDVLMIPENQVRYAVMGEVNRPGTYNYPDKPSDATVLKVLSQAGGPTQGGANLKASSIVRIVNGQSTVVPVDIAALLKTGTGSNAMLQPGDILYIPPKKAPSGFNVMSLFAPLSLLLR